MGVQTDGELCELFAQSSPNAMSPEQRSETKTMVSKDSKPAGPGKRKRRKAYTLAIFLSGTLICISFGTMIGWPSPSYPTLLSPDAPIPITIDQSAMIAGMLLNGFAAGTPFSGYECLGSKFGIVLGTGLIFSGWIVMIGASSVIELCISRVLVGIGSGFGIGKLRIYLKEICTEVDNKLYQKLLVLFVNLGIVISFAIGPFVPYKTLSIIAVIIPGFAFLIFIVIPDTPYNLLKHEKDISAKILLQNLYNKNCVDDEIQHIKYELEHQPESKSFYQILRKANTRKSFFILTFLMTIQQFSGGPTLIVYSQIIFTELNISYPYICSIVYSIIYLIASGIGVKYTPNYNRKPVLLLSYLVCTVTSALHAYFSFLKPEYYYMLIPFITMLIYAIFHTSGSTVVTQLVINDIFPVNSRKTMVYYWNMYTSVLAVIVTKIFQVLYARFGMPVAFSLFTSISTFGFFIILLFLLETKDKLETSRGTN